jgi:hypothetical protein
MKIQILGTGCHNCLELERRLAAVIIRSGCTDVVVERIDDEHVIRRHLPLDAIPGLLIDGKLVNQRSVPDEDTLLRWITQVSA